MYVRSLCSVLSHFNALLSINLTFLYLVLLIYFQLRCIEFFFVFLLQIRSGINLMCVISLLNEHYTLMYYVL